MKLEAKVKAAIVEEGRIEEDIQGVKMEKVCSKVSTKQAMIARTLSQSPHVPMPVVYLNHSVRFRACAGGNRCRVRIVEHLRSSGGEERNLWRVNFLVL